jgi:hypothetical protein
MSFPQHLPKPIFWFLLAATALLLVSSGGHAAGQNLREISAPQKTPPDLTISDLWTMKETGQQVCFQIQNLGGDAPAGFENTLWLDSQVVHTDTIGKPLTAGQRYTDCTNFKFTCKAPTAQVQVCTNTNNAFSEGDLKNNCLAKTWSCDQTPPVITKEPLAVGITQNSATISWNTDEDSDSQVSFDTKLDAFGFVKASSTFAITHDILLGKLEPGTTYEYRVQSTDASSNTVVSDPGFFTTLPAPSTATPDIQDLDLHRIVSPYLWYTMTLPVSGSAPIQRVEYSLDGIHAGTDYPPGGATGGDFTFDLVPSLLGIQREAFITNTHQVTVTAYSTNGLANRRNFKIGPFAEPLSAEVDIENPTPEQVFYYPGSAVPASTHIDLTAFAMLYEDDCAPDSPLIPGQVPLFCLSILQPVNLIEFHVRPEDGSFGPFICQISGIDAIQHVYHYNWDASGLAYGRYEVEVTAYGHWRSYGFPTLSKVSWFTLQQGAPVLEVQRQVTRTNTHLNIQLSIHNSGALPAGLIRIDDNSQGFQPVFQDPAPTYSFDTGFNHSPGVPQQISFYMHALGSSEPYALNPGASVILSYQVVPYFATDQPHFPSVRLDIYQIGADPGQIQYWWTGASHSQSFNLPAPITNDGETLLAAVQACRQNANLMILSTPDFLYHAYSAYGHVYERAAQLAVLRDGILAYQNPLFYYGEAVQSFTRSVGATMRGADGVDRHFLLNGYLLIVGETKVVPSWQVGDVSTTDMPYADTDGDQNTPELIVGRMLGSTLGNLESNLQYAVETASYLPTAQYDRSKAIIISGVGIRQNTFEEDLNDVQALLVAVRIPTRAYKVSYWGSALLPDLRNHIANTDIFYYEDHCNFNVWGGTLVDWDLFGDHRISFGNASPFVMSMCCLAGRYADIGSLGLARGFLNDHAGGYIGSTEESYIDLNQIKTHVFWAIFDTYPTHPPALDLRDTKLRTNFTVFSESVENNYQYNYYGDPKFGLPEGVAKSSSPYSFGPALANGSGIKTIDVSVPGYTLTQMDGFDQVNISNDSFYVDVLGMPRVPFYRSAYQLPDGVWPNQVRLVSRSEPVLLENLNLAPVSHDIAGKASKPVKPSFVDTWPAQDFTWSVQAYPDGHNYLVLDLYAFQYYPQILEGRFFNQYSFQVDMVDSAVRLLRLNLPERAAGGETLNLDLWLQNQGSPQDVYVSTEVRRRFDNSLALSLPLQRLAQVNGMAKLSLPLDTTGLENGVYTLSMQVLNLTSGLVMDRKSAALRIGYPEAELSAVLAAPSRGHAGQIIKLSDTITSTGTTPVTGMARLEIHVGSTVVTYTQAINNLKPGSSATVTFAWHVPSIPPGRYPASAWVSFDSRSSEVMTAWVEIDTRQFLPIIKKK